MTKYKVPSNPSISSITSWCLTYSPKHNIYQILSISKLESYNFTFSIYPISVFICSIAPLISEFVNAIDCIVGIGTNFYTAPSSMVGKNYLFKIKNKSPFISNYCCFPNRFQFCELVSVVLSAFVT